MTKIMLMQRPQLQDKLYIVMQKWDTMQFVLNTEFDRNDWNALFHTQKLRQLEQPFFSGSFSASRIFSGGFLVNAENIQLGV